MRAAARNRGTCGNRLNIRVEALENMILDGLRTQLLEPELFKVFCDEFHREMNRLFDDASRGLGGGRDTTDMALMAPRMDIHESENALEVTAELPVVSQNDVDLRIEGDVLTVRGEKRNERQDKQAHIVERSYESFQRSVQLPFAPDPAQVEALPQRGLHHCVLVSNPCLFLFG